MFAHQGNPRLELLLPEGEKFRLFADWWFVYVDSDGTRYEDTIPAGYVTDFGSIPWFYRWRFSRTGKASPAFLVHDWYYFTTNVSRAVADRIMRGIMSYVNVCGWDRIVMWLGVRAGGWTSYGKKKKAYVGPAEA